MNEIIQPGGVQSANLITRPGFDDVLKLTGFYQVVCRDARGHIKWEDEIRNLVTTVGKNDMLDKYFAGSTYTASPFMGLVDNAGFSAYNAADTMASHAGWAENVDYDEATRPAVTFGAAAAGVKATSAACVFTISASVTIKGCFITTVSTKSGTTGILYSVGNFSGGDRAVVDNDTISASYSATQT
jgi:hypothetical protein